MPLSMPFDSVKHYEDYIARPQQIPRVLSQTTEVLRAGMRDKLMPVSIPGGQRCPSSVRASSMPIPS